jgi:hypothetical protein
VTAALIITILIAALLLVGLVAEEILRREWRREAASAHKRECHHGGTTFQAYPGDDAERAKAGRRTR